MKNWRMLAVYFLLLSVPSSVSFSQLWSRVSALLRQFVLVILPLPLECAVTGGLPWPCAVVSMASGESHSGALTLFILYACVSGEGALYSVCCPPLRGVHSSMWGSSSGCMANAFTCSPTSLINKFWVFFSMFNDIPFSLYLCIYYFLRDGGVTKYIKPTAILRTLWLNIFLSVIFWQRERLQCQYT